MKIIFLMIIFVSTIDLFSQSTRRGLTIVRVVDKRLQVGDTIFLSVKSYGDFYTDTTLNRRYSTVVRNSQFKFAIHLTIPARFVFSRPGKSMGRNMNWYMIEPGYNLSMICKSPDSIDFKGHGANRVKIQFEKEKIYSKWHKTTTGEDANWMRRALETMDSCSIEQAQYLASKKK